MLVVNQRLAIPLREFNFTFSRSAGPGGQNVNKVNTKATLRWSIVTSPSLPDPIRERFAARYRHRIVASGEVLITSQRFRDQGRNVADCLAKLRQMLLEVVHPPKVRKATRPSGASRRRRLDNKVQKGQQKRLRRPPRMDD